MLTRINGVGRKRGLVVDNFAGGGGASTGMEKAIGRSVDIAINHDMEAIRMHKANHPTTKHYCESVWDVDPVEACEGQPVDMAWFSPDCRHFSKAKGGGLVNRGVRGLAWVAVKWAKAVKPKLIFLENVEEFRTWGPVDDDGKPIKEREGETFNEFLNALKVEGYEIEYRELVSCDYGAPTSRKRFFLVARCDGNPIVWPEPTHADPLSEEVLLYDKKPFRTAGEIIDWSFPTKSIFARDKPLSENTMKRIAKGLQKFVINSDEPFLVPEHNATAFITSYYTPTNENDVRGLPLDKPLHTITSGGNRFGLVTAFLTKYYGQSYAQGMAEPLHTITTKDRFGLVTAFLTKYYGTSYAQGLNEPLHTVTAGGNKYGLVTIEMQEYMITDIHLRMLQPVELFRGNGFPSSYIIDRDYEGRKIPKSQQIAKCGNAVTPQVPAALVRANAPELCFQKEAI
ncbi:MAG: DNA cytosine methyltransferase [Solibacillus sp.]|uniref:DNA cytosine methyltransferase n=1 Tax=Solibacillus sp. TaxID=1909654 RepID=UPI003314C479